MVIVASKIITIIDNLTQVLKQQNYKLEASNANLSMMSSTMSPLQVIVRMITITMDTNIANLSESQLREVRVSGAGVLGIQAHLCW